MLTDLQICLCMSLKGSWYFEGESRRRGGFEFCPGDDAEFTFADHAAPKW